ncbi:MAG: sensor histidine kinase [bacterium]
MAKQRTQRAPTLPQFTTLKQVFESFQPRIIEETLKRFGEDPGTDYKRFVLKTDLLRERAKAFCEVLVLALEGDRSPLRKDQANAGYDRALRGFNLGDVLRPQDVFRWVLYDLLAELQSKGQLAFPDILKEVYEFYSVMIEAYQQNALSFIRTREELINEKVNQLQALYDFTQELLAEPPRSDAIFRRLFEEMIRLFPDGELILAIWKGANAHLIFHHPENLQKAAILPFLEQVGGNPAPLYMDETGSTSGDIDHAKMKTCVVIPWSGPTSYRGVLVLRTPQGFAFTLKESHLIQQFLHLSAVAIENAEMLVEVERKQRELQVMTNRMLEIREEERKKLAADLHDTFAQTLVFLDYRLQYFGEVLRKEPELLQEKFAELRTIVKRAADQCRVMISSLRPDLIDTLGLTGALRRLVENFEAETGIDVETHFSDLSISGKTKICLFRVAQEALNNVSKHAQATSVDFSLKKERDLVRLVVSDNGLGFDASAHCVSSAEARKLGLLFMKERIEGLGGELVVASRPGSGCRVEASIPYTLKEDTHGTD